MKQEQKIKSVEFIVIILLWTLVVISPLLFMDDSQQDWRSAYVMWAECGVVGCLFLINRFFLMPCLFFKKKYAEYILVLLSLLVLLGVFVLYYDGVNLIVSMLDSDHIRPAISSARDIPYKISPPPRGVMPSGIGGRIPPSVFVIPPALSVMILSVIVVALDMGLSIAVKWVMSERKQAEVNRERISAQLSNLQSQVSPHFFMNTLNNIHALVDIDAQRAKDTIIELSALMDYLLYKSSHQEVVPLVREMEFIESYVKLMRLRYPDEVEVEFSCRGEIPQVEIPPLLFLNFIENSFKYGIDYDQRSYIRISFEMKDGGLEMVAVNSNHSGSVSSSSRHGLGISNTTKRLDLLYGSGYTLEFSDSGGDYLVKLLIPVL